MLFGEYKPTGCLDKNGLEIHDGDILGDSPSQFGDFLVDYSPLHHKWVIVNKDNALEVLDLYDFAGTLSIKGHVSDYKASLIHYWEYRYGLATLHARSLENEQALIEKRIIERMNIDFNLGLFLYSSEE